MNEIEKYFEDFLNYLNLQKDKIAYLQLIGKIEGYLVKEFCYFIYKNSGGKSFNLINVGNKNEQKIDICLLKGNELSSVEIYGMIEVKYFRNRHRYHKYNARDEIRYTLSKFKKQLHIFKHEKHGGYNVNLDSINNEIFGLVFASYIDEEKILDKKEEYYKRILITSREIFKEHNISISNFKQIYDDEITKLMNSSFYVTLKASLWKIK